MKELLNSRFARYAALIAAAMVGWFVDKGFVLAGDAAARTGELTVLINGLFAALGAIGLWVLLVLKQKIFGGNPSDRDNDNRESRNQSGGSGSGLWSLFLMTAAVLTAGGLLSSCAALVSATTGAPPPSTAVQRAGHPQSPPVLVASADLAQAEAAAEAAEKSGEPAPVHGLYDAGRAAKVIREVFTESSK